MNSPQLNELKNNDILRKRLAKLMAKFCFRDTKILKNLTSSFIGSLGGKLI
jgi:hypothetical protein